MEQHERVHLFLDRDSTGQKVTQYALSLGKQYRDESRLYKNYKDLNDWMVNIWKIQNKIWGYKSFKNLFITSANLKVTSYLFFDFATQIKEV